MYSETLKCGCIYSIRGVERCRKHEEEIQQATARWAAQHIAANPDVDFTPDYRARAIGAAKDLL